MAPWQVPRESGEQKRPPALFRTARGWVGGASVPPSCPTRLPLPPRLCAASACTANPALFSLPLLCRVSLTWRVLPPTSPRRPRPPARASRPHRGNSPSGAVGRRLRQDQRGTPARAQAAPAHAWCPKTPQRVCPRPTQATRAPSSQGTADTCIRAILQRSAQERAQGGQGRALGGATQGRVTEQSLFASEASVCSVSRRPGAARQSLVAATVWRRVP